MFKVNNRYRHINCLDIDFDVYKVLGESNEYIGCIVAYWNRHSKCFQGGRLQVISIKRNELNKWKEIPK